MKYFVKIGLSEAMNFVFDTVGDALDFAAICLGNGYRCTIIPVDGEEG